MSKKYSHWGKLAPAAVVIAAILVSGKGDEVLSGQEIATDTDREGFPAGNLENGTRF